MPGNGGGRSKRRQAEPAVGAEAALEGLERGGTAAPVLPPHTEGARRRPGVTLRGGWARESAQAHLSGSRARSRGRALRGRGRAPDSHRASAGARFPAGLFIQTGVILLLRGKAWQPLGDVETVESLSGLSSPLACVEHLVNHFCMCWVIEMTDAIVAPNESGVGGSSRGRRQMKHCRAGDVAQ